MNRPSLTKSHPAGSLSSSQPRQAGSRVGPALLPFASLVYTLQQREWKIVYTIHFMSYLFFPCQEDGFCRDTSETRPYGVHTVPNYRLTKSFDFLIENCQKRICINLIAVDLRQKYLYPFLII